MIRYVEWIRDVLKLPIVLIPHQIYLKEMAYTQEEYQSGGGDDRYPIERILSAIKDTNNVFALQQEMTPQEFKGVIGRSEIFIGSRMHSVIAAVSLSVPSLVMQYSHKSGGMMQFLGMDEFVWDVQDDYERLTEKTQELWNKRQTVRTKFKKMMPGIYQEIYDLTNEIDAITESCEK